MSKRNLVVMEGFILEDECNRVLEATSEFMDYEDNLYHIMDDLCAAVKGTGLKVYYMNKRTEYSKFRRKETVIAVGYPIFEGTGALADGQLFTEVSSEISEQTESELKAVRDKFKLSKLDAKTYIIDARFLGEDDPIDWKDI